jgi:outer membrane protein assembly factor BamB
MMARRQSGSGLSRRAALLLPLATAGCDWLGDWFGETKEPLPGIRVAVMASRRGLEMDKAAGRSVVVPPPQAEAAWPQAGGNPAHVVGNPALGARLAAAWQSDIGEGGGYRRKITAQPVAAAGRVFTMDADAVVSAFSLKDGGRLWRQETQAEDDDSTNVGGGIALDGDTLYAATGLAEVVAFEAATGKLRWRKSIPAAARAAPTIAEGRLYIPTLGDQVVALAADDGHRLWGYQATTAATSVLGLPSPAYADGVLVAGFGSGDLVGLRVDSGAMAWSDSLAASRGRTSLADLSAIRGRPAIVEGRVYAVGLGGLMVSLDLRTGRRLWEREVSSEESPWVAGDWVFILSDDNQLAAIDRADGAVAWVTQLPRYENEEKQKDPIRWVGPALAGGRLFVAGTTGIAKTVDPATGKELGQFDLSGPAALAPAVADATLLQLINDGKLQAFR